MEFQKESLLPVIRNGVAGGENAIRKAKDGEEALEINETTEMDLIFKANVADSKFKMRIRVGRIFGGGKIRG